jgi:phosphoribosylamine---glycine ligase
VKVLVMEMEDAGCGLDFVLRCIHWGHSVRYFLRKGNNPHIGKGFKGIEYVDNWATSAKWADLIFATGNDEFMGRMDYFRKQGAMFFGPSLESAKLEINRQKGMEFLEKHDIECPEYKTFQSLDEAAAYQKKSDDRYVFKTLGSEEDKSLSYVGKTPADMIARIQRWKKLGLTLKGPCMLQRFIPGIEFAVSRWLGSDGFVGLPNENFERKKLLSGDCGPNCGEAGTVMKYAKKSKLHEDVLDPLEDSLVKIGHLGDVDVNCIIDAAGKVWPLEFTMRPGWPAFNIMLATHKGDPVQWMLDACKGEDTLKASTAISVGVVLAQPDYPYSKLTKTETLDIPIYGITEENKRFVAPQSVKMAPLPQMIDGEVVTQEMWATCGDYIAVVTGTGKSVKVACERAYKTIKDIHVPDMMYRDDIGEKLEEMIPEIQKHGYATEFVYGT